MSSLITTDTKPKESKTAHLKRQALGWIDRIILILMRVLIWAVLIGIIAIDIAAVLVTLVVIFQDDLPPFIVDFVRDILLAGQRGARLSLQMVNLDGLAEMARDGLKALALLWVGVTALTVGATWLAHTAWQRKYKKATPTKGKGGALSSPSEVIMPLTDPLLLEMNDEFSRYIHRYSFNLDLRCRTPQDAAGVNAWIDALKTTLSNELVRLAKGSIVQVRREEAIAALSEAAQSVSGGAIVGVILRGSDYIRLNKPASAVPTEAPPEGQKARVKMSTSWGAKAHSDLSAGAAIVAAAQAEGPMAVPPMGVTPAAGSAGGAGNADSEDAPTAPAGPRPIGGIGTETARDLLAGIRG
jgi:hypothetical protein